jgi:hypothetical protein
MPFTMSRRVESANTRVARPDDERRPRRHSDIADEVIRPARRGPLNLNGRGCGGEAQVKGKVEAGGVVLMDLHGDGVRAAVQQPEWHGEVRLRIFPRARGGGLRVFRERSIGREVAMTIDLRAVDKDRTRVVE